MMHDYWVMDCGVIFVHYFESSSELSDELVEQ